MQKWHKIFKNGPILVQSPEAMISLGQHIGAGLEKGDVLGLVGDLGAGKTHLVQGIMEGLGSHMAAASPTFSLVHEHIDGRLPACHFDFYRLRNLEDLFSTGWEDYLNSGRILIIEWADMFPEALPHSTQWLHLEHHSPRERLVTLYTPDDQA